MRVLPSAGLVLSLVLVRGLVAEVFTEQKVAATGPSYSFGGIVSVDGGTAVSRHATNRFSGASETVVLERSRKGWEIKSVTNERETGTPFVAQGDEIIYQDVRSLHVYRRERGEWRKVQTLEVTQNPVDYFDFWALTVAGDRMAALGRFQQAVTLNLVTKLFIFRKMDGMWKKEHEILEDPAQGFVSLAMASDSLDQRLMALVQSNNAEERWHLRIYRFDFQGSTNLVQTIVPPPVELKDSLTGTQIAMDGQWAMVGNGQINNGNGAVYMYRLEGIGPPEVWELQQVIRPDAPMEDGFGSSIALAGDKLLVGAPARNERQHKAGAAFLFEVKYNPDNTVTWLEKRKFVASDGQPGDRFGQWVSFSDDTYAIGAPGPFGKEGGAIYFFEELPEVKVKRVANGKLRVFWPLKHGNSRLEMSSSVGGDWQAADFPRWAETMMWVMELPPDRAAGFFRVQRDAAD